MLLNFLKKNKHALFALYIPVYMHFFTWLEARNDVSFQPIHCFIDDIIPFNELFVIPYVLWFLYVLVVIVYLYFQKDHLEDYYHWCDHFDHRNDNLPVDLLLFSK